MLLCVACLVPSDWGGDSSDTNITAPPQVSTHLHTAAPPGTNSPSTINAPNIWANGGTHRQLLALVATSVAQTTPTVSQWSSGQSLTSTPTVTPEGSGLSGPGPYNLASVLPTKVVKKILDLEFIKMSEIYLDDTLPHTLGEPPLPPIQNISAWIEKYGGTVMHLFTRKSTRAVCISSGNFLCQKEL